MNKENSITMNPREKNSLKRSDKTTSIQDLRELTSKFVDDRNWRSYHTPRALSEAISIEAAELLENFLFKKDEETEKFDRDKITDEMADIVIYLMSLCNTLELESFSDCIFKKMEKNKIKYPINKFAGENYSKQ